MRKMTKIEKLKHEGQCKALRDHIFYLKGKLDGNWANLTESYKFVRFSEAMDDASMILAEMRDTWNALIEIEPENK
jgi:hypothetical protein